MWSLDDDWDSIATNTFPQEYPICMHEDGCMWGGGGGVGVGQTQNNYIPVAGSLAGQPFTREEESGQLRITSS